MWEKLVTEILRLIRSDPAQFKKDVYILLLITGLSIISGLSLIHNMEQTKEIKDLNIQLKACYMDQVKVERDKYRDNELIIKYQQQQIQENAARESEAKRRTEP